ncbi:hypothetical protein TeGR_g10503, partial [Tetraparma gracilis]
MPHAQTSSTLTHTSLIKTPHGDSVFLLHAPASPPQSVPTTLSASKWSLFYASLPPASDSSYLFPAQHPFTPTAQACDYLVPERVIVVNLLTWQVGHLIVDVLEPLFHLLSPEAGGDSKNNRIFLNVANSDESGILHELILRDVYEKDTPFVLLKLFTHHPVHPAASLYEIGERVCFEEIVLEPDSSRSYYTRGQLSAPKFFDMKSAAPDDLRLKDDYKAFQRWLNGELGAREQESNAPLVLFVERKHKRRLRNLAELSGIARSGAAARSLDFSLSSLEGQPFPNQLDTFRRTRVLVAQYGSGGHNVLFLPPGGVLVLLLQPGWCDQAWAYGNQALLSGASVVAVCSEVVFGGDVERRSF